MKAVRSMRIERRRSCQLHDRIDELSRLRKEKRQSFPIGRVESGHVGREVATHDALDELVIGPSRVAQCFAGNALVIANARCGRGRGACRDRAGRAEHKEDRFPYCHSTLYSIALPEPSVDVLPYKGLVCAAA